MLITNRTEIEEHIYTDVWNEIVSKYQELYTVSIEIPENELEIWVDSYTEEIAKICEIALMPFQERADKLSYIYVDYVGEAKWLRRFSEKDGSWYEMLCDEVLPSWMMNQNGISFPVLNIR